MPLVLLVLGLMPACRLKNFLLTSLAREWWVSASARIHPIVIWRVRRLRIGDKCAIGPGNVLRDLVRVELAEDAAIGQLNWITAETRYAEQADPAMAGSLVLDEGAAIASRHYLDCAGGVRLGRMSIVAGVRSTFLTHWADHHQWVLRAAPIRLEPSCIVSATSTVTAGSVVPERSVVAAGAVVAKALEQPGTLYGGVPARVIADLADGAHATRTSARFFSRAEARAMLRADRARSELS